MAGLAVTPVAPPSAGAITFTSNDQIEKMQQDQRVAIADPTPQFSSNLYGYIRRSYDDFRSHRDSAAGWNDRMLRALRAFNGEYDPTHLAEIQKFNGTQAYLRLIAMKARAASSLLRDVYLNSDRPWGLEIPADPDIPVEALQAIIAKVQVEIQDAEQSAALTGEPIPDESAVRDRVLMLYQSVKDGIKRKLQQKAQIAEDKIHDLLNQGGFYTAFADFLLDLVLHPLACIKGPEVKIYPVVVWDQQGRPSLENKPRLTWARISPFDIWFTPGVADIKDADVIERVRYTRADLNVLLDLPGYNHEAVRRVLMQYGQSGFNDDWESTDSTRATLEHRENPLWNRSRLITGYKFSGNVQGIMLLQYGMDPSEIEDPVRDYTIEAWCIGPEVIKVQKSPAFGERHNYCITSYEKVPGTPAGNALPDSLGDIQDAANATFRSLINNQAMASGPQVVVKDDRLSGTETGDDIYPWKRWHVTSDPFSSGSSTDKPIDFYQPTDNSANLLTVLQAWLALGDDVSAIPRYLQGNSPGGGAGRTASGLAMLMGNASKILQTVAANIDRDILDPLLKRLLNMILLTDATDVLDGTEKLVVKGVAVAMQRETQRSRQLELLQITANPIDLQIIGPKGRAALLRGVSQEVGLPGDEIVPSQDEIEQAQQQAQQTAQMLGQPGHSMDPSAPAGPEPAPGGTPGGGAGGGGMPAPVQPSALRAGPRSNLVGKQREVKKYAQGGFVEPAPAHTAVPPGIMAPLISAIDRSLAQASRRMEVKRAQDLAPLVEAIERGFGSMGTQFRFGLETIAAEMGAETEIVTDDNGMAVGAKKKRR